MVASTSSKLAHRQARAAAAAFLDEEDAELLRQRAERRRRVAENVGQIAANDEESAKLTARLEELRLDSARLLAAVVEDGVSVPKLRELTGREEREIKAAVKAARDAAAEPESATPAVSAAGPAKVPAARANSAAAEAATSAQQPAA